MAFFGRRASAATLGLGLLAAFTGTLAGGSSGPGTTRYEVTAPLLFSKSGPVYACFSFDLMGGCGGVPVRGAALGSLPIDGQLTVADVGITTLPVRLVGSWDGTALTLSQTPEPETKATGIFQPCEQGPSFDANVVDFSWQRRLVEDPGPDGKGLHVIETMPCDPSTLGVVVVVADEATLHWLTTHYPPVRVTGWLRLLPTGP